MKIRYVIALASLLAVCNASAKSPAVKTYTGPDRPATETASVMLGERVSGHGHWIQIGSVDGVRTAGWFTHPQEVVVLPGKHRIRVQVTNGLGNGLADLWLVAEAGKKYVAKLETDFGGFEVWLEDAETGARVGGIVGSDDEPANAIAPTTQ
jgi:hypothetical protein